MINKLFTLFIIWSFWTWLLFRITEHPFDPAQISTSIVIPEHAGCEFTRSNEFLELSVRLQGSKVLSERSIALPTSMECNDELLSKLVGNQVVLTDYRNFNLGIAVEDEVLIDFKYNLERVKNPRQSIYFSLFIAIFASIIVMIRPIRRIYSRIKFSHPTPRA